MVEFIKMHHCGNDFIIIDHLDQKNIDEIKNISKKALKRKYGIGADNVLYICKSKNADALMKIYNITDVEGENCGNGSLCVGKYLIQKLNKNKVSIETISCINEIKKINDDEFMLKIPDVSNKIKDIEKYFTLGKNYFEFQLNNNLKKAFIAQVGGEPHAIIFAENIENIKLQKIGDKMNKDKETFPLGINVNLVEKLTENSVKIRTYERSVLNETDACGTGSCASAFISKQNNILNEKKIGVITKGGKIIVEIDYGGVNMIGQPTSVFRGSFVLETFK